MSAGDAFRHFLRADYWTQRSTAVSTVVNEPGLQLPAWNRLREQLADLVDQAPWLLLAAAMVGAARLVVRRPWRCSVDGSALLLAFVLAGPWGDALHVMKPYGIAHSVVERFYVLPMALVCIVAARGVDVVLARVRHRFAVAALACVSMVVYGAVVALPEVREYTRPTVELYATNTLKSLPRDAALLGSGDHRFYGLLYAQDVLGLRRDVRYVDFALLPADWYRERVSRRLGVEIPTPDGAPIAANVVHALLSSGRPLFVANHVERLPRLVPRYPWGTVHRVLELRSLEPDPFAVEEKNLRLFEAMDREATRPADKWSWAGDLDGTYDAAWLDLAKTFEAAGMADQAAACLRRVR
jgi:hypothetical protein